MMLSSNDLGQSPHCSRSLKATFSVVTCRSLTPQRYVPPVLRRSGLMGSPHCLSLLEAQLWVVTCRSFAPQRYVPPALRRSSPSNSPQTAQLTVHAALAEACQTWIVGILSVVSSPHRSGGADVVQHVLTLPCGARDCHLIDQARHPRLWLARYQSAPEYDQLCQQDTHSRPHSYGRLAPLCQQRQCSPVLESDYTTIQAPNTPPRRLARRCVRASRGLRV